MKKSHTSRQAGFSTLMAIGTIAVLLIIVAGLATTYIREMKLSRTSYDEVIAYANAEGMFEYAMLKMRNHREGFADSVENSETDGKILIPSTPRSQGMQSSYIITANSSDEVFDLQKDNHLILPLFTSAETYLSGLSKNPQYNTDITNTTDLSVSLGNLSWTIVAMSGSESVGLTGSGDISSSKYGIIRHKSSQCYDHATGNQIPCSTADFTQGDEELQYFYDEEVSVSTFLSEKTDPYLMIFNDSPSAQSIEITSTTPFSLPTVSVTAQARKNDSVQVFRFTEDKSRYYDALKYGVYNNQ